MTSMAFNHVYSEEHNHLPLDVTLPILGTLHIDSAFAIHVL